MVTLLLDPQIYYFNDTRSRDLSDYDSYQGHIRLFLSRLNFSNSYTYVYIVTTQQQWQYIGTNIIVAMAWFTYNIMYCVSAQYLSFGIAIWMTLFFAITRFNNIYSLTWCSIVQFGYDQVLYHTRQFLQTQTLFYLFIHLF